MQPALVLHAPVSDDGRPRVVRRLRVARPAGSHAGSITDLVTRRLQIYVVGHTDAMVASVPRAEHLVPIDLRRLTVPARYDTNSLAEGRFLLSREATQADAEYVGICSANWSMRFSHLAPLEDLRVLRYVLRPDRVFAAQPGRDWRARAEESHPGMKKVLDEIEAATGLAADRVGNVAGGLAPYNNAFICHRRHFNDLLAFWHKTFAGAYDRYGPDLPYGYRCASCGHESPTGVGRFMRDRHAGYLGERVTMLFFAHRDLSFWMLPPALTGSLRHRAFSGARWYGSQRWPM